MGEKRCWLAASTRGCRDFAQTLVAQAITATFSAMLSLLLALSLLGSAFCGEHWRVLSRQRLQDERFWSERGDNDTDDSGDGAVRAARSVPDRKAVFRQCVKPWQTPMMTLATISKPSQAVTCHPDYEPCEGEGSECQFSFSAFQYICCRTRDDVKPPECPKYHTTLRTLCGGVNDVSCPRSFKCLPSRFDPSIEICCKPNATLVYPEPDTSFRDNLIVPEYLPHSPITEIQTRFKSLVLAPGQLVANDDVEDLLASPPTLLGFAGDESKLYTVLIFGFLRNAPAFVKEPNRASLYWLVNNVAPFNGTLGARRASGKEIFPYLKPTRNENPSGIHTMVVVVFEQRQEIGGRTEVQLAPSSHDFVVKEFLEDSAELIDGTPVAGSFYGFVSADQDVDYNGDGR